MRDPLFLDTPGAPGRKNPVIIQGRKKSIHGKCAILVAEGRLELIQKYLQLKKSSASAIQSTIQDTPEKVSLMLMMFND